MVDWIQRLLKKTIFLDQKFQSDFDNIKNLYKQFVRTRFAMFFLRCMSRQSVERDTVSVIGLIVNSDNLTKRRKVRQNHLQAVMTKKFGCSINGRLKPQHSTSYVCIQRQRLESSNKLWLIGSQACEKKLFFSTRNFEVISTISNKSEISYQR